MGLIKYVQRKLYKKRARRITREYDTRIDKFHLAAEGEIEFANWTNPLVKNVSVTQTMVDFFKKFITPGDFVIDIGANIGDTTVPMALAAGKEGLTLGFDPNPFVFKILKQNSTLNSQKLNIIPLRFALTVKDEEFFYISSEASFANGGISTTRKSHHGKFIFPEKIKGINLQKLLEKEYQNWLPRLSFIKIDAEGHDKEILKSIRNLLVQYYPVVVAESFGPSSQADKQELYTILADMGYAVYYFEDFFAEAKIVRLNSASELSAIKKTVNVYGIREK